MFTQDVLTSSYGVSIIILTRNAGRLFKEVLSGLFACTGIDEAEIILIDSGSQDLTLHYASQYPQIQVHQVPRGDFGHGRTRNLGARLATGDILVYLVQDATPATADFLARLAAPLSNPRVVAAYGRQLPRASTNPIEKLFLQTTYPARPQLRDVNSSRKGTLRSIFFSNVCSAIKREIWKSVPFDEGLIMSEDQKWAKEVLQNGYAIAYEPAATVFHSHNYGLRVTFQRNFDSGYSLRGVVTDSFSEMVHYEVDHVLAGIKQLVHDGNTRWIPYFFCYEVARSMGFFWGTNSHLLPSSANYHLSLHKFYWK
ncbi:MAG: glycosyltransferase family 2 protein [bacterium]